jgi:hypothetical protein
MKKKLKVKKAFRGSAIQARRMVKPGTRPTMGGSPRPGMQLPRPINVNPNLIYDKPRQLTQPALGSSVLGGGRPINVNPNLIYDKPRPGMQQSQQPAPVMIQPAVVGASPVRGGMGPRPNNFGPMQGVGDPRRGAAFIPGNSMQEMMRGPQQAAPVQPVPAMKKGGMVRGQGAAIRGTKFKGIF